MKLIVAGVGPGDPELATLAAVHAAEKAGLLLLPCSHDGKPSVAGGRFGRRAFKSPRRR